MEGRREDARIRGTERGRGGIEECGQIRSGSDRIESNV